MPAAARGEAAIRDGSVETEDARASADAAVDAADAAVEQLSDPARFARAVIDERVRDRAVLDELLRGTYWVPLSTGRCARIVFEPSPTLYAVGGAYRARVSVRAPSRASQGAFEIVFSDDAGQSFGAYTVDAAGTLRFLIGLDQPPYTVLWDGTALELYQRNSIEGNAVLRLHPLRRSCLAEASSNEL